MRRLFRHRLNADQRRGSIAIVIIMTLAILQIAVVGIVLSGARDADLRAGRIASARSLYAADAALHLVLREMAFNEDFDGDGGIGTLSNDKDPATDIQLNGAFFYASAETTHDGSLIHLHASHESSRHHVNLRTIEIPPTPDEPAGFSIAGWTEAE